MQSFKAKVNVSKRRWNQRIQALRKSSTNDETNKEAGTSSAQFEEQMSVPKPQEEMETGERSTDNDNIVLNASLKPITGGNETSQQEDDDEDLLSVAMNDSEDLDDNIVLNASLEPITGENKASQQEIDESDDEDLLNVTMNDSEESDDSKNATIYTGPFDEKLRQFAVEHKLPQEAITELLQILFRSGIEDLPQTYESLFAFYDVKLHRSASNESLESYDD